MESKKQAVLDAWINDHKELPKQGSDEWLAGRQYRIGGSELGAINGTDHFKSLRGLVEQHLGIVSFTGNAATRWGKMLEDITQLTMEKIFNCKIYVPGSIQHWGVPEHANSPDGVAYISLVDMIILFEFKNPSGRIPGNTIPKQYITQVKSGLDTIPICDMAIFVDHMQRKCSLSDLEPNLVYDTTYHNQQRDRVKDVLMITMVGLYSTEHIECDLVDYGKAPASEFDDMLLEYDNNTIKPHYGHIHICDGTTPPSPQSWCDTFIEFCEKNKYSPIGILPLKTFRISLLTVNKEPDFIEKMRIPIMRAVDIIRKLTPLPLDEQISQLDIIFETDADKRHRRAIMKHLLNNRSIIDSLTT